MIKYRIFINLVVFLLTVFMVSPAVAQRGIVPVPSTAAGNINTGQNWLFVIGINKYKHWPILKSAVNDAKSLKKVLTSRYYFDDEHTIELYDKEATREGILRKLRYLATHVKPDDSVLIFYAGHGHVDPITKVGHWIPVESEVENTASYLSNFDVKSYLKIDAIKAKHILLVSDSCFAGEFFRSYRNAPVTMATKKYIEEAFKLPSRMAITSGGLEPVSDDGFGGNSIFAHYLLTALKVNSRPFLLPSEIFPRIKEGVAENVSQFPRFGAIAGTGGQQGGEMVFFLRRDASLRYKSSLLDKQKQIKELEELRRNEKLEEEKKNKILEDMKQQLDELDNKILGLKKNMKHSGFEASGGIDDLHKLVREKENHALSIANLKFMRRYEEAKKLAKIAEVKLNTAKDIEARLKADLKKFHEISSSIFGSEYEAAAWESLRQKYPILLAGLNIGEKVPARNFTGNKLKEFSDLQSRAEYLKNNKKQIVQALYEKTQLPNDSGWEESFWSSIKLASKCDKMSYIPGGIFLAGAILIKEMNINDFCIDKYEVTQEEYLGVMGENQANSFKPFLGKSLKPMDSVTWHQAKKYCLKVGKRLPTEWEWEKAAKAGTTTKFYWGNEVGKNNANCDGCGSRWDNNGAAPVGSFAANKFGLYDMAGNVWEWTDSDYDDSNKVIRGGSWNSIPGYLQSTARDKDLPDRHASDYGFRCAK